MHPDKKKPLDQIIREDFEYHCNKEGFDVHQKLFDLLEIIYETWTTNDLTDRLRDKGPDEVFNECIVILTKINATLQQMEEHARVNADKYLDIDPSNPLDLLKKYAETISKECTVVLGD